MSAAETSWEKLPDGLRVKAVVNIAKAGVASITIVTRTGDDIWGSLTGGRCTRRNSHLWDVALYRRAADPRDPGQFTTPTLHELGAVLGDRLREKGAWWQ